MNQTQGRRQHIGATIDRWVISLTIGRPLPGDLRAEEVPSDVIGDYSHPRPYEPRPSCAEVHSKRKAPVKMLTPPGPTRGPTTVSRKQRSDRE